MALNSVEASVLSQCPSLYPSSFVSCVNEGVSWLASHNGITYYTSIMVATDATVTSKSGSLVRIGLIDIDRPLSGLVYYEVLSISESVDSVSSATVYKVKLKYKSPLGIEISLYPFTYYNATLNSDSYYTATEVDAKIEELQSTITELKEAISNISSSGSADIDLSKYVTSDTLSTTLEGYVTSDVLNTSLENYYTKEEVDTKLSEIDVSEDTGSDEESGSTSSDSTEAGSMEGQINYKALIEILNTKANVTDVYTKEEVDSSLELKANVTDVYTKEEVDAKLEELSVDNSETVEDSENGDSVEAGTMEGQLNYEALVAILNTKANVDDVYTKDEVYSKEEVDAKLEELSVSVDESEEDESEDSDSTTAGSMEGKINYEALVAILNTKANAEDVYSKEEADELFVTKEEFESKISEFESAEEDEVTDGDSVNAGTMEGQLNYEALVTILNKKANVDDVYTKSEVDETLENYYTKEEVDSLLENVDNSEDVDQPEIEEGEDDTSIPAQPSVNLTSTESYTMNLNLPEGYSLDIEVENEEVATATYEDGVIKFNALSNGTTTATITISKQGEEDKVITISLVVELEEESSGDESEGEEDSQPADEMTPEVKTILLTSVEDPYMLNLNVTEEYELSVSTSNEEVAKAEYKEGSIIITAVGNGQTTLDIVVKKDDEEQTISINVVVVLDTTPDDGDESDSESKGDDEDESEEETPDVTEPEEGEEGDKEDSSTPSTGMEPQEKVITLTSKDEPYTMSFNIPEGYSVSASVENEEVASVTVDGGDVTVSAVANGETVLNIVVSKEDEELASQSIKVVVELEDNTGGEDPSEPEEPAEPEPVVRELTGIEVTTMPSKTEYFINESFDAAGMVVTGIYSDSTSEEISDYTVSPVTFEEAGETDVTISYGDFTTSITVTVKVIEKVSMSVKTQPSKTEYFVGESFDSTGLVLEIAYSNNSTVEVTDGFTVEPSVFSEAGDEIAVTITYEDITTTFNVKVIEVVVESLEVTAPNKVEYYAGDQLDTEGLVVVAKYNNGVSEEVQDYELSVDMSQAGEEVPVTVTYKEVSATFNIKINEVVAESMSIETEPTKVAYFIGDTVDLSGLVLKISYNNGKEELITEGYAYDAISLETEGSHVITVTYGEFSVEVTVVAYEPTLESLTIKTDPDKTEYFVGDKIDYTGLVVEGSFSNGKTVEMEEYNVSPEVFTEAGEIEVVISVGEISTSFKVNVTAVVVTSIDVTNPMTQLLYYVGDSINTDGLEVTAYYNNDTESVLSSDQYTISPVQFDTAGYVEVTIASGEFTTKFTVEVLEVVLESISVTTQPTKTEYYVGDKFDSAGMVVTGYYSNGTSEAITGYIVEPEVFENLGEVTVNITYENISTSLTVNVEEIPSSDAVEMDPQVMSVELTEVGQTHTIDLNVTEEYTLEVSSSDENVATVEYKDGSIIVTAVNDGQTTVTITAKKDGEDDITIDIAVKVNTAVTFLSAEYTEVSVREGESINVEFSTDEDAEVSASTDSEDIVEVEI